MEVFYFDTDVEVIRNMDNLVQKGAWMAIEKHKNTPEVEDMVNPWTWIRRRTI